MNIYYNKFIDFLKRHDLYDEQTINYLWVNSKRFDYRDEDMRDDIGYYFFTKNGKLSLIVLKVPFLVDDITVLINIHEFIHGIILYKKLGKKYNYNDISEMLPMMYEELYVLENPNEDLIEFKKMLDRRITDDSDISYRLGLRYKDKLIEMYNNGKSFDQLNRKTKKLARRSKIQERKLFY